MVEFNPARVMDLDGDTLCTPDKLEATVVWAIKGLSEALMPIWCYDRATAEIRNHDHALSHSQTSVPEVLCHPNSS